MRISMRQIIQHVRKAARPRRWLQTAAVIVFLYLAVIVMFDEMGLVIIAIHLGLTGVSFLRLPTPHGLAGPGRSRTRPTPRAESSSPLKH
jgi:chromate transport protein ChrA